MYRLLINRKVEDLAQLYAQTTFQGHPKLETPILKNGMGRSDKSKGLYRLKRMLGGKENKNYRSYVSNIIKYFDTILTLKPSEFESFKTNHFNQLTSSELEKKVIPGNNLSFHELVLNFMKYDYARERLIELTKNSLDITTCVYCNKNPPTSVDHYKAKSNYPFLCISFYNMFPSCKDCNQFKGDREFTDDFNLYRENGETADPYIFDLMDGLLKYVQSRPKDKENFDIDIVAKDGHSLDQFNDKEGHLKIKFRYNDKYFHAKEELEKIYGVYSEYRGSVQLVMQHTYPKLNPSQQRIVDCVMGDSSAVENTHKNSFNKLKFDFGKLLGII